MQSHIIRWVGSEGHVVGLLQLDDRNKPSQSFVQWLRATPLPLLEPVCDGRVVTAVEGEIDWPHDPCVVIRSDAFVFKCSEVVSQALVAVHCCDVGAAGCVVSDGAVVGQEHSSSVGDESATVVLDEDVDFAGAGYVAAASEPPELAESGRVEVGQSCEFAVDAGGVEEMVTAYEVRSVGVGLEDYVVGALRKRSLTVGVFVGIEDDIGEESLAVEGLLFAESIVAVVE